MDIVDPHIEEYMRARLARFDEPVLLEMEAEGAERNFPIVGRNVGVTLEILARSVGARRVIELGSGYGYSGYWHARAVGRERRAPPDGRRPRERTQGRRTTSSRAGLWAPVTYHVGDAVTSLNALDGEFDVVYDDIDKEGYPDAWRAARERIRDRRSLRVRQRAVVGPRARRRTGRADRRPSSSTTR